MGVKLLSGVDLKKSKLMSGHKWVVQIGKLFFVNYCKWQKEVIVIDREEGIFLFQVCLCSLNAFSQ